ncbi:MAG: hypothetical protein QXL86_01220 [Candidatus Aenigmatarchaeota archaeon]
MSEKDGFVHLWDLPDHVYIDFKLKYRLKLLNTLKYLSPKKNWYSIAKLLFPNKNCRKSFNLIVPFIRRNKKISLKIIKRISKVLVGSGYKEFSLENNGEEY